MKRLILFLFFLPAIGLAHPGIAIVINSKGIIYYSDLQQVWKIINGKRSIAVPNVHTHELHLDGKDNLYGEHVNYEGDATKKYTHHLWMLRPTGVLDTLVSPRQAYVTNDYSLARDKLNNEFYLKESDTDHIFKRSANDKEEVFATGEFKGLKWLHPQKNGSLLYTSYNTVYRIDTSGKVTLLIKDIGNKKPSFKFSGKSITLWGAWEDRNENVCVAVFSDQTVKKITKNGKVSDYYKSQGNWAPTHGVFDNKNQLWVLECSDKNEIRAVLAKPLENTSHQQNSLSRIPFFIIGLSAIGLMVYYNKLNSKRSPVAIKNAD